MAKIFLSDVCDIYQQSIFCTEYLQYLNVEIRRLRHISLFCLMNLGSISCFKSYLNIIRVLSMLYYAFLMKNNWIINIQWFQSGAYVILHCYDCVYHFTLVELFHSHIWVKSERFWCYTMRFSWKIAKWHSKNTLKLQYLNNFYLSYRKNPPEIIWSL